MGEGILLTTVHLWILSIVHFSFYSYVNCLLKVASRMAPGVIQVLIIGPQTAVDTKQ